MDAKNRRTAASRGALRRADQLIAAGYVCVVDADLKAYFDTIPHDQLMTRVETKISDGRALELIQAFLKAGIMDGLKEWIPTQGAPQGSVLSPLTPVALHSNGRGGIQAHFGPD